MGVTIQFHLVEIYPIEKVEEYQDSTVRKPLAAKARGTMSTNLRTTRKEAPPDL